MTRAKMRKLDLGHHKDHCAGAEVNGAATSTSTLSEL
jgi:hypothetical protein